MKAKISDWVIAWLALLSGLSISAVAIYYSVAGLVSIFAAAAVPIIIMGVVLEVGKLVATVWLKQNWSMAPRFLKGYLLSAITVLMIITSMGIFGYLSKAHLDQAVPTGEVVDRIALIDEKIKTERDNIDASRKALQQMDDQVNQRLSRSDNEQGAERAVQIRRQQAAERAKLQKDIADAQIKISKLNEEKAPLAKELRKVEAEVGPIKYIAALIYGDNPDNDLLERAVRWVIIIIVLVFDPLAVILLLASQYSFNWFKKEDPIIEDKLEQPKETTEGNSPEKESDVVSTATVTEPFPIVEDTFDISKHPYLFKTPENRHPPGIDPVGPQVYVESKNEPTPESTPSPIPEPIPDSEEDHIPTEATDSEKSAMARWKSENPGSSLKLQRQLLEKGIIKELPWIQYLKPQPDYDDTLKKKITTWIERQGSDLIKRTIEK